MRPKDGAVRAGRIGNRIRGVVARLAVCAREDGRPIRNGQIFRVRYRGAAAVAVTVNVECYNVARIER